MDKFTPTEDYLLVARKKPKEVTKSGLIVPISNDTSWKNRGKVIEDGKSWHCPGFSKEESMWNDLVLFKPYTEIELPELKQCVEDEINFEASFCIVPRSAVYGTFTEEGWD